MEFIWKIIMSLVLSTSLLTGVTPPQKAAPAPSNLVVQITATTYTEDLTLVRRYTDPKKIETILYYLRSLHPREIPETDPERYLGAHYKLTLEFSDGGKNIYRQYTHRWLSKNSRPWQRIDPEKGELLAALLDVLPGDG